MGYIALCAQKQHQVSIDIEKEDCHTGSCLDSWIHGVRAKEGNKKIVLLIDEHDAPVASCFHAHLMNNPRWKAAEHADTVAAILKSFYIITKSEADYFHLVFVTGACLVLTSVVPPRFFHSLAACLIALRSALQASRNTLPLQCGEE